MPKQKEHSALSKHDLEAVSGGATYEVGARPDHPSLGLPEIQQDPTKPGTGRDLGIPHAPSQIPPESADPRDLFESNNSKPHVSPPIPHEILKDGTKFGKGGDYLTIGNDGNVALSPREGKATRSELYKALADKVEGGSQLSSGQLKALGQNIDKIHANRSVIQKLADAFGFSDRNQRYKDLVRTIETKKQEATKREKERATLAQKAEPLAAPAEQNEHEQSTTTLGKKVEPLAARAEEIANTSKNLMDVFQLRVPPGKSAGVVADDFIKALEDASTLVPPMSSFTFDGKTVSVDEKNNQNSMKKLNSLFQGPDAVEQKAALIDHLENKAAISDKKAHISAPIRDAIEKMQTHEDASPIGFYLMSEVTSTGGGKRTIDPEKLKRLLNDPRIKNSPELTAAVLKNARETQLAAIRQEQANNIVWNSDTKLDRASKQTLEAELERVGKSEDYLDFSGVKEIAQRVGVDPSKLKDSGNLPQDMAVYNEIKNMMRAPAKST